MVIQSVIHVQKCSFTHSKATIHGEEALACAERKLSRYLCSQMFRVIFDGDMSVPILWLLL